MSVVRCPLSVLTGVRRRGLNKTVRYKRVSVGRGSTADPLHHKVYLCDSELMKYHKPFAGMAGLTPVYN